MGSPVHTSFKSQFLRFVKRQAKPVQLAIEDAVESVARTPLAGVMKAGDLRGIRVHKFTHRNREYLIAYRISPPVGTSSEVLAIEYLQIGTHENFYSDLKKYLKASKR